MITETNWDLWLLGFVLAWVAIELTGFAIREYRNAPERDDWD